MNDLSVIIATKNEENYIAETLKFLRLCMDKANKHGIDVELIVVDSSNDQTLRIAQKFTDKAYSFSIQGVSRARNYGCKFAEGKILIFMDADTLLLDDKTLIEAYNCFLNPETVCVLTYVCPIETNLSLWLRFVYLFDKFFIKSCERLSLPLKFYTRGDFFCVRKGAFDKVKGFNEKLYILEITDLLNKILDLKEVHKLPKYKKVKVLPKPVYDTSRRLRKWKPSMHFKVYIMNFFTFYVFKRLFSKTYEPIR